MENYSLFDLKPVLNLRYGVFHHEEYTQYIRINDIENIIIKDELYIKDYLL